MAGRSCSRGTQSYRLSRGGRLDMQHWKCGKPGWLDECFFGELVRLWGRVGKTGDEVGFNQECCLPHTVMVIEEPVLT